MDEGRWTVRKRSIDRRKKPRWERREKQGHKESTRENEKVREREEKQEDIEMNRARKRDSKGEFPSNKPKPQITTETATVASPTTLVVVWRTTAERRARPQVNSI